MNATIATNRKGELALQLGGAAAFKRRPTLTADTVAAWQEIISETRGGAAGAVSKVGQAVARAALPGAAGKAASAAVDSAVDSVRGAPHTVRVDWVDGKQSLIQLPDKLFQHLAILLKDCQLATAAPGCGADTRITTGRDRTAREARRGGTRTTTGRDRTDRKARRTP